MRGFSEEGTSRKQAPVRVGLLFPGPYRVAASSLGFQVLYRWLTAHPLIQCERYVLDLDEGRRSIEHGLPPSDCHALAVSVSYEPDLLQLLSWLRRVGLPPMASARGPADPLLVLGGPVTTSNVEPFLPFVDLAYLGELEPQLAAFLDALAQAPDREAALARLSALPGFVDQHTPLPLPPPIQADRAALPCAGAWVSPEAELADRFLIEITRGCPERCHFCIMRAPRCRFRVAKTQDILDLADERWPRVGLVGAAVSRHPRLKELLEVLVSQGKEVGLSSIRADVLDDELATLLRAAGHRSLTVAADGLSERIRASIEKGVRREDLTRAGELARRHGFSSLRLYQVIMLPGEEPRDLDEWAEDLAQLASRARVRCSLSFFVPKRDTPLEHTPPASAKEMARYGATIRKRLGRVAALKLDSPREAWLQRVLSLGDAHTGLAALKALDEGGGSINALQRALGR
jgi:radical SAM superfamily enzyme YgiQ (UPF0313 family)